MNLPMISVVIPNYNGAAYLERCLQSLLEQSIREMEIIVVDNASSDASIETVTTMAPEAILLKQNRNLGFAGGVNAGILASHGEWVAVLNNDTELALDWLSECLRGIQNHPRAAFFACRILEFTDRARLFSAGDCYLRGGIGYRRGQELRDGDAFNQECEVFAASGCAALYRRDVLDKLGAFDARFFAYLEDVDLGLRLQMDGRQGFYLPRAIVFHHGAATSGGEFSPLAVRLRTRNSLFLLQKNLPLLLFLRCLPMILLTQASWFVRAAIHKRLGSCLKGLGEAFLRAPAMLRERGSIRRMGRDERRKFWDRILQSESLARIDTEQSAEKPVSLFLKWYFRLF